MAESPMVILAQSAMMTLLILLHMKHQTALLFPLLSSFPSIFDIDSGGSDRLAMRSALSTSSAVAERLMYCESIIRRSPLVSIDSRNNISEELRAIAEEYTEGWDSDIDMDDDDL